MPFKIDRVPQGLLQLLSTRGGLTPAELEDRVQSGLDLLQFYGLQQRRVLVATNAAAAEGATLSAVPVADADLKNRWALLFAATASMVKTGTMTAARLRITVARNGGVPTGYMDGELGPFGATETGTAAVNFVAPYPMLLAPPWDVSLFLAILGTDANASVTAVAEVGIL